MRRRKRGRAELTCVAANVGAFKQNKLAPAPMTYPLAAGPSAEEPDDVCDIFQIHLAAIICTSICR